MLSRLLSLILLILLSPLLIFTAIIIYLEDGGPVFFLQRRIGQNKNLFWIYKFRTMKKDTPNVSKQTLKNPSLYHLNCGSFIRDFSIDEIPNLINILKGEMNFIGPRPALYNEYEFIELREKAGVNVLKPGLTGWAQVNGRDYLTNEKKCMFDKAYLENKSIIFDFKILFLTLSAIAKPIYMWFKKNFYKV